MLVPLALALTLGTPTLAPPAGPVPILRTADDYDALLSDYAEIESAYEARLKAATDGDERRRLRKTHPAGTFWPRFLAAAEAGEGRAYLWLLENARHSDESRSRQRELKARWCSLLVERHLGSEWFGGAVDAIAEERRALGDERLVELLTRVAESGEQADTRARACLALARTCSKSRDAEIRAEALRWYERLVTAYPESSYAKEARPEYNRARYLRVGGDPLDFEATTVDGESFKLSDYRGKVVLLDFWGFW